MQVVLVLGYTFLFIFIIRRMNFFSVENISPNFISLVFVLKVLAGCSLGLLYTYYYKDRTTADTFKFFDDSKIISNQLFQYPKDFLEMLTGINGNAPNLDIYYNKMSTWLNKDVLFNDNKTIIRLNVIFNLFSIGYYYVNVVFINFISFIGLIALFKLFQFYQKDKSKELFAAVMLLPSMLFWGSGLLKDGLLLFALGVLLYSFNKLVLLREKQVQTPTRFRTSSGLPINLLAVILSGLLLIFTKLYVIIAILPGLIALYWSKKDGWKRALLKFTSIYLIYLIAAFNIGTVVPKYDVTDLIYWKQKNFCVQAQLTQAKSVIQIPQLQENVFSIIQNSPHATVNLLTRPTITEASSPLMMMSAFENIFILLVILVCLFSAKGIKRESAALFIFSIIFVILMFDLIGLITPILGAMVRYKVPALPFLMFVFISLYDKQKFLSKWKGAKREMS